MALITEVLFFVCEGNPKALLDDRPALLTNPRFHILTLEFSVPIKCRSYQSGNMWLLFGLFLENEV